jgi:hypothetical protein
MATLLVCRNKLDRFRGETNMPLVKAQKIIQILIKAISMV